jgi:hypothetical protein
VNTGETLLFPVLCASRREPEGHLAVGGLRALGRHRHHRLGLYRKQSCWKPPLVASTTARMSVNCRCFAESVALRLRLGHTGTTSKEASGGISRTGTVQVIILNVCSVTHSCRLAKTDVALTSASQTVSYDQQPTRSCVLSVRVNTAVVTPALPGYSRASM